MTSPQPASAVSQWLRLRALFACSCTNVVVARTSCTTSSLRSANRARVACRPRCQRAPSPAEEDCTDRLAMLAPRGGCDGGGKSELSALAPEIARRPIKKYSPRFMFSLSVVDPPLGQAIPYARASQRARHSNQAPAPSITRLLFLRAFSGTSKSVTVVIANAIQRSNASLF